MYARETPKITRLLSEETIFPVFNLKTLTTCNIDVNTTNIAMISINISN